MGLLPFPSAYQRPLKVWPSPATLSHREGKVEPPKTCAWTRFVGIRHAAQPETRVACETVDGTMRKCIARESQRSPWHAPGFRRRGSPAACSSDTRPHVSVHARPIRLPLAPTRYALARMEARRVGEGQDARSLGKAESASGVGRLEAGGDTYDLVDRASASHFRTRKP